MNYNILAYCIFIPIIFYKIIKVGWLFYSHGEIFLLNLFQQKKSIVKNINNILLMGYYRINLGYAIITISYWEKINSFSETINSITYHLGIIIIGLALLHYNNIICLTYIIKSKNLKQ